MKKILKDNTKLIDLIIKSILIKPFIKYFRFREKKPTFWTIPHDSICREILINGFYEKELMSAMVKLTKSKGTVLDIGANIGNHSIYFSNYFSKVIAFEPLESNCWIFKSNLHINNIQNVELIEKGLGKKKSKYIFTNNDPYQTNSSLKPVPNNYNKNFIEVSTGDDALLELKNNDDIVMIKIDVEGLEPDVILGLSKTIRTNKPIIFWEAFTENNVEKSKKILEKFGYNFFYHITNNRFKLKVINKFIRIFGKNVYIDNIENVKKFDGVNVASIKEIV